MGDPLTFDWGWWRKRRPSTGVLHPHVDCTPEDLARLRQALLALP